MDKTKKALKEWNATIEALGEGKQTILIRTYGTHINEFLLYPTNHYALKEGFLNSFKDDFKPFVEKNAISTMENNQVEIKYFARVEKIVEKIPYHIDYLDDFFVWTKEHVRSYLKRKKAFIWVLRVYKLKNHVRVDPAVGIKYVNLNESISLKGLDPVMDNDQFKEISGKII
ncbi:MAG: DUF1802 family protein [Methanobacterium sp.]